jgi:hypothetical protein
MFSTMGGIAKPTNSMHVVHMGGGPYHGHEKLQEQKLSQRHNKENKSQKMQA